MLANFMMHVLLLAVFDAIFALNLFRGSIYSIKLMWYSLSIPVVSFAQVLSWPRIRTADTRNAHINTDGTYFVRRRVTQFCRPFSNLLCCASQPHRKCLWVLLSDLVCLLPQDMTPCRTPLVPHHKSVCLTSPQSFTKRVRHRVRCTWCVQVLRSPKEAFAAAMQSWRERCEKMCLSTGWLRWEMTAFSASCDE